MANGGQDDIGALLLQGMEDPETAKMLAEMGIYPDAMGLAGEHSKRGAALYGTPSAEGRQVGNTYVASSPLEHLGVAVQRGLGARQMQGADAQRQSLMSGDVSGRMARAKMMIDAMKKAQAVGQPPMQGSQAQPPAAPGAAGYDATAGFDDVSNYG